MADSDDEDILYDNDLGRNLIGGKRVKNVNDVLNGGKKDKRKLRKTLALCMAFLCLGLCIAVLGPTLLSLKEHLDTTLPKISWVFTGRSLGYLTGAILGGMLFESFNPIFLLAISLLLCGIGITVAPFVATVLILGICICAVGISMGVLDTGANLVCLRMWGKKRSGTMLQALHFSFALGAFISPLVAAPFLAETPANNTMLTLATTPTRPPTTTPSMPPTTAPKQHPLTTKPTKPLTTTPSMPPTTAPTQHPPTTMLTKPLTTTPSMPPTTAPTQHPLTKKPTKPLTTKPSMPPTTAPTQHPPTTKPTKPFTTTPTLPPITSTLPMTMTITTHAITEKKPDQSHRRKRGADDVPPPINSTEDETTPQTSTEDETTPQTSTEDKTTPQKSPEDKTTPQTSTEDETTPEISKSGLVTQKATMQSAPQRQVERFAMAYIIIGVLVILSSLIFFYFLCTQPKDEPHYTGSDHHDEKSDKTNFPFRTRIIILLFFFYFLYVGGEVAYGSFVSMFASESSYHYEKDRASHLAALFWGCFALGRGLAICLASVISPLRMVIGDMVGCVATSLALTLFADSNENVLWIGSAVLGFSMASLFPSGIAWLESYTPVTGNTASFLVVGSALGEMCVPLVIGYLFEDIIGPMVLMYWMLATSAVSALIFVYVIWLVAENGQEKESLPAEKSPALELFQSVEEALPMEEIFKNGKSNKQMTKQRVPPILKRKDHRE